MSLSSIIDRIELLFRGSFAKKDNSSNRMGAFLSHYDKTIAFCKPCTFETFKRFFQKDNNQGHEWDSIIIFVKAHLT